MFEFTHTPELPPGFIYHQRVISSQKAWLLYDWLKANIDWQQPEIRVFGKLHAIPRLQAYIADSGLNYQYSNLNLSPNPWPEVLLAMRKRLEQVYQTPFNAVLLNYYRSGDDTMGWHSDDEPELGDSPIIASVSLGAVRKFAIKSRTNDAKWALMLEHGSALMMSGASQQDYLHSLPRQAKVGDGRINLTFRYLLK